MSNFKKFQLETPQKRVYGDFQIFVLREPDALKTSKGYRIKAFIFLFNHLSCL